MNITPKPTFSGGSSTTFTSEAPNDRKRSSVATVEAPQEKQFKMDDSKVESNRPLHTHQVTTIDDQTNRLSPVQAPPLRKASWKSGELQTSELRKLALCYLKAYLDKYLEICGKNKTNRDDDALPPLLSLAEINKEEWQEKIDIILQNFNPGETVDNAKVHSMSEASGIPTYLIGTLIRLISEAYKKGVEGGYIDDKVGLVERTPADQPDSGQEFYGNSQNRSTLPDAESQNHGSESNSEPSTSTQNTAFSLASNQTPFKNTLSLPQSRSLETEEELLVTQPRGENARIESRQQHPLTRHTTSAALGAAHQEQSDFQKSHHIAGQTTSMGSYSSSPGKTFPLIQQLLANKKTGLQSSLNEHSGVDQLVSAQNLLATPQKRTAQPSTSVGSPSKNRGLSADSEQVAQFISPSSDHQNLSRVGNDSRVQTDIPASVVSENLQETVVKRYMPKKILTEEGQNLIKTKLGRLPRDFIRLLFTHFDFDATYQTKGLHHFISRQLKNELDEGTIVRYASLAKSAYKELLKEGRITEHHSMENPHHEESFLPKVSLNEGGRRKVIENIKTKRRDNLDEILPYIDFSKDTPSLPVGFNNFIFQKLNSKRTRQDTLKTFALFTRFLISKIKNLLEEKKINQDDLETRVQG